MSLQVTDNVRTVSELKRNAPEIIKESHKTGRPIRLTVNGKTDAVIMDARCFERHLSAANLARLLQPAEEEIATGRTRPMRSFLKDFKRARKISR